MDEIDFKEIWGFFKKKIIYIMLITVIAGILGMLYMIFLQTPKYKSYTSIVLISENGQSMTNNDLSLNQNLVRTYTEIIKSKSVLKEVTKNLDLNYSYNYLYKNVEVTTGQNSQIINISVIDKDPKNAKVIADEIGKVFSSKVLEYYDMSNVNILDKAEESKRPYNINVPKQIIISLFIGFVLSAGGYFLIYYFDRSIKSSEQIENKIGFPILGTVQESKKVGNNR